MWHEWIFPPTVDSVGCVLSRLPEDYVVVEGLLLPEGRIEFDYVVAGPNGLFAIEMKDWAGEVKCTGHDWFIGRKRVPSPGRPAQIKAAALRKTLVHMTYDGERMIPPVSAVLTFTDPNVTVIVSSPAVPAMRVEELVSFIVHYKNSEVDAPVRAGVVRHLSSFPSRPKPGRRFFGMKLPAVRRVA